MEDDIHHKAVLKQLQELTAETSVQRKALELLADRAVEHAEPIDYSADIGGLSKCLAGLISEIEALKESPAFARDGEHILDIIKAGTRNGTSTAVREVNAGVRKLADISNSMGDALRSGRQRHEQDDALKIRFWGGGLSGAAAIIVVWVIWALISGPTDVDVAWASSQQGRNAQVLANLNGFNKFLDCTGSGWQTGETRAGRKICVTGERTGWFIPE
jgi:hypothetical protein